MTDDFRDYDVWKTMPPEDDTDRRGRPTKLTDLDRALIAQAKEHRPGCPECGEWMILCGDCHYCIPHCRCRRAKAAKERAA